MSLPPEDDHQELMPSTAQLRVRWRLLTLPRRADPETPATGGCVNMIAALCPGPQPHSLG